MNYGKAVEEVWTWRDEIDKKLKDMSKPERSRYIHEHAKAICEQYGIPYKVEQKRKAA